MIPKIKDMMLLGAIALLFLFSASLTVAWTILDELPMTPTTHQMAAVAVDEPHPLALLLTICMIGLPIYWYRRLRKENMK